jgi:hypothetical protein
MTATVRATPAGKTQSLGVKNLHRLIYDTITGILARALKRYSNEKKKSF